jgi:enoyl-CoA hydratase/carnithine racemase
MLSEMLDAKVAIEMGIVNKMCRREELVETIDAVVHHLKQIDPFIIEITKNALM